MDNEYIPGPNELESMINGPGGEMPDLALQEYEELKRQYDQEYNRGNIEALTPIEQQLNNLVAAHPELLDKTSEV